jgi:hypothetical protein
MEIRMEDEKTRSKSGVIGVRLSAEELERFELLVEKAKRRNTLSDKAAVARELMGFPAVPQTITDEDRRFLVSGREEVEVVPPGRLSRKQEKLIQKVKEILLYGYDENPEDDLTCGITVNILSIWAALKSRPPKDKKSKTKTSVSRIDRASSEGESPVPG